jgi:hypothetical protein
MVTAFYPCHTGTPRNQNNKTARTHFQIPRGAMATRTPFSRFRASDASERLAVLRVFDAIAAMNAHVVFAHAATAPARCVAAVLGDAQGRLCVMGGREGLPRSLGSVNAGSIIRFLGGCRGVVRREIPLPTAPNLAIAVTRDGSKLLVGSSNKIHVIHARSGVRVRVVGNDRAGPRFKFVRDVFIAADDFVFVADSDSHHIRILTPSLDSYGLAGAGQLRFPDGVCADADVIAVCELRENRISIIDRRLNALVRRFGKLGHGAGQLLIPIALRWMGGERGCLAVVEHGNKRISVFGVNSGFIRHIDGVGGTRCALSSCLVGGDELVVSSDDSIRAFSAGGEQSYSLGLDGLRAVAMHQDALYATTRTACLVIT